MLFKFTFQFCFEVNNLKPEIGKSELVISYYTEIKEPELIILTILNETRTLIYNLMFY